ncbi:MAG: hypothetical protein Q4D13_07990 [Erysipelotrichaceae bacterium]|nr:hypothetical protein [Erysipelotrichaceae bacterium]
MNNIKQELKKYRTEWLKENWYKQLLVSLPYFGMMFIYINIPSVWTLILFILCFVIYFYFMLKLSNDMMAYAEDKVFDKGEN